jgi:hypothetical protein
MANKFLNGINVTGTTTLNTVANAGTDTDKFLVLDASGNVDFRTGDELYADLGIGSLPAGFTSTVKHAVKAGVALTKGQAVYVTGADGTNMIVGKASNASEATSSKTMGLIETTLSINGIGNVITEGLLTGLDTTGATNAGDPVWLGTDGNLIYGLTNKPYAPAHLVFIGIVTRINANNGEIFVKVQNGFELNEIHDVDLKTTTPINGHILGYNGTLWVNKTIAGWLGFTPADDSLVVKLAGAQTITGAKSFDSPITLNSGIGFLNGVMPNITSNLYSGIGGNSNGISIITRPVSTNYTNNLYFAASNNSFTFPNATGTIALTSDLTAYVPTSRTLTINGVAYDLSADRAWTIEAGGSSASTRTIQKFTSTAAQTTFTITGGYTVGMVDVWVNGSKLDNAVDFTASNGTTVVLTDALTANQIVEVYKYGSQFIVNNGLRQKTLFTATAAQTTFTVAYSVGLVDVYYNGSKLDDSEFTATNGTSIVLGTACAVNDKVEVIAFSYNVNGFTGIGGSGTTNNLPKFTAAGTIGDSAITDNGTTVTLVSRALSGTSATFSGSITAQAGIIFNTSQTISSSGVIGFNSTQGLFIYTKTGSAYDFKIYNGVGSTFMQVPTGTQNVEFLGSLSSTSATFSSGLGIATTPLAGNLSISHSAFSNAGTKSYTADNVGGISAYVSSQDPYRGYLDIYSTRSGDGGTLGGSIIRFLTSSVSASVNAIERMTISATGILTINNLGTGAVYSNSGALTNAAPSITATGGTITTSGGFKYHTFNSSGTFQVTAGSGLVEVFVLAGGGAGGGDFSGTFYAGGGGAGGAVYNQGYYVEIASYTVTVGAGGAPNALSNAYGGNGNNSVFGLITAIGGGGGTRGNGDNANTYAGLNGGCGGGGGSQNSLAGITTQSIGTGVAYGNNGYNANNVGGGGGGIGTLVPMPTNTFGGYGRYIFNLSSRIGGGGGGGVFANQGVNGNDGGGRGGYWDGSSTYSGGFAATANTGGGGGGCGYSGGNGGAGGSGIVIVRYKA